MTIRRSEDRGHFNHGWLDTYHTFSFARYQDPEWLGYRSLRVINDDRVAPGGGFGMHPHRDMEIVTIVLDGALEHQDSLGSGGVLRPGDVQAMSAGTGILHSEFNPSDNEPVHLLQVWIEPSEQRLKPRYDQRRFELERYSNRLQPIASPDGREDSLVIHQDAVVLRSRLSGDQPVAHDVDSNRHVWVQVARGTITANGERLETGDGAAVSTIDRLLLQAADGQAADVVLFDLA